MQVDDPLEFLKAVQAALESDASLANSVSRIVPVTERFEFNSVEEFDDKAAGRVESFLPKMTGTRFFVRVIRRGFKGKMSSHEEERKLGDIVRERLGPNTTIDFDDPDWILVIEVLGNSAGMAVWGRADLEKYELLRIE